MYTVFSEREKKQRPSENAGRRKIMANIKTTMESLERAENNWVTLTKNEKVSVLREAIFFVSERNFEHNISDEDTSTVLAKVNTLMMFL
jgi:Trm5-related predicted tRNA methylase